MKNYNTNAENKKLFYEINAILGKPFSKIMRNESLGYLAMT